MKVQDSCRERVRMDGNKIAGERPAGFVVEFKSLKRILKNNNNFHKQNNGHIMRQGFQLRVFG